MQDPYSERFEAIECDISDTKEKMGNLETALLETNRFLAYHDIEDLRMYLEGWLTQHTSKALRDKVHDFLVEESALAKRAVETSLNPLSAATNFANRCAMYFDEHNLGAFRNVWDTPSERR